MKNNEHPLVSVIIPVYNGSNYLKYAIESSLSQTYERVEVIVINDGSNDDGRTREVAKLFGRDIRYFEKLNGGVSTALNMGIDNMKGDYFCWLSHDDMFSEEKIEIQIDLSRTLKKTHVIYSNYNFIDERNNIICQKSEINKNIVKKSILIQLLTSFQINAVTTLIPKEIIKVVELFNPKYRLVQDYDYWFRIGQRYKYFYVDLKLASRRIHNKMASKTYKIDTEADDLYYGIAKYVCKLGIFETISRKERISIITFLKKNNYIKASNFVKNSTKQTQFIDRVISDIFYLYEIKGRVIRSLF